MGRNEYLKQWRENNPDKVKAANKRKYEKDKLNPNKVLRKKKKSKEWYENNTDRHRTNQRVWCRNKVEALKEKIYDKLGHVCCRCGFADKRALCIDHINGGGVKELQKLSLFAYLKKVLEDTDNLYQILCHNCNWIKRHENEECRKPLIK